MRRICDVFYGTEEIHGYGLGQDEDQGQLGAWYVMSSIGLFDVKGLVETQPSFQLGSPLFDEVEIMTDNGKTIRITTKNNLEGNVFIQSISLNGKPYHQSHIGLDTLKEGAHLEITLGNTPEKNLFEDL